jgi:hypothetical protein
VVIRQTLRFQLKIVMLRSLIRRIENLKNIDPSTKSFDNFALCKIGLFYTNCLSLFSNECVFTRSTKSNQPSRTKKLLDNILVHFSTFRNGFERVSVCCSGGKRGARQGAVFVVLLRWVFSSCLFGHPLRRNFTPAITAGGLAGENKNKSKILRLH